MKPMFLIIHNPLSSNKKSKKRTSKIVKFCQKNDIAFNLRSTLKIDNLNDFLNKNPQITDIIYCGGDGSFNYLVNHVDVNAISQRIHLAQSGSGNDFIRTLKRLKYGSISISCVSIGFSFPLSAFNIWKNDIIYAFGISEFLFFWR